jgi:hypothetical protein
VRAFLNDRLIQIAPDLPSAFVKLDEGLPPVATMFGVRSELRVLTDGAVFVANHRVPGISFGDRVFALLDFGIGTNIATDIDIAWSPPQLGITQHFLPVPVGTVVRIGLDKIVLPTIDGAAAGLADLYDRRVDCPGVGQAIFLAIGQGSAAVFAAACDAGLAAAGGAVYQQLDALDNAIAGLQIASTTDASDTDGDGKVNRITGSWTGTVIEQSKPPGSLVASFVADRL